MFSVGIVTAKNPCDLLQDHSALQIARVRPEAAAGTRQGRMRQVPERSTYIFQCIEF